MPLSWHECGMNGVVLNRIALGQVCLMGYFLWIFVTVHDKCNRFIPLLG